MKIRVFRVFQALVLVIAGGTVWGALTPASPAPGASGTSGAGQARTAWAASLNGPASPYSHVLVVARSGGDFTSVQSALDSIGTHGPNNTWLVWVAPGVYTETNGVAMKSYVDIEGAGEDVTRISRPGTAGENTGTVIGANNAELRSLTVESTGGDYFAIAVYNNGVSPRFLHVTAVASGTTNGRTFGMRNVGGSSPKLKDTTIRASGPGELTYGLSDTNSSPALDHVFIRVSGPAYLHNFGVSDDGNSSTTMDNVTIDVSGSAQSGSIGVSSSSVSIANSAITVSGSSNYPDDYNFGISAGPKAIDINNVTVDVSGAQANNGLDLGGNGNACSCTGGILNSRISASGPSSSVNYGIVDEGMDLRVDGSIVQATGPGVNRGILAAETGNIAYTVKVNNSRIVGARHTIDASLDATIFVGASQLAGGPLSSAGPAKCAGVYGEGYTFYPDTCP